MNNFWEIPKILDARDFGRRMHDSIGQKRKYSGVPYWTHTEEVAEIVWRFLKVESVVIGAILHDHEDILPANPHSIFTLDLIERGFGSEVRDYVINLTDIYTKENYPYLNRADRKKLERERLGTICPHSQTIKLADIFSNTKDIVEHDKNFAIVYLEEKRLLLPYLKGSSAPGLFELVEKQLVECEKLLTEHQKPSELGAWKS